MANRRCSVETYSSLKFEASLKACSSSLLVAFDIVACADSPETLGSFSMSNATNKLLDCLRADADFFEYRSDDAFFVFEQGGEEVDRQKLGVAVLGGEVVG